MKTSLSHLPESKQEQIHTIVEVINSIVEAEKIILYGSYAKGTYQEDNHSKKGVFYEYVSDYDILLIIRNKDLPEYEIQDRIVNRINYKAPLNVLICYLDQVNEGLEKGQYFFTEIIETGILIYDRNSLALSKPRKLSSLERREIANEDFDLWYTNAIQFLLAAEVLLQNAIEKDIKPNLVAYQLHQAVEALYATTLLVFTGYKPKTHNLDKYKRQLKTLSIDIVEIFPFPTNDKYEWELFSLLKQAYIGGRYKKDFEINIRDLKEIVYRVNKMKEVVKKICLNKIASF